VTDIIHRGGVLRIEEGFYSRGLKGGDFDSKTLIGGDFS